MEQLDRLEVKETVGADLCRSRSPQRCLTTSPERTHRVSSIPGKCIVPWLTKFFLYTFCVVCIVAHTITKQIINGTRIRIRNSWVLGFCKSTILNCLYFLTHRRYARSLQGLMADTERRCGGSSKHAGRIPMKKLSTRRCRVPSIAVEAARSMG